MNDIDAPLLPVLGEKGPQVCAAVRFYLAVVDDLPFEQVSILSAHIQECANCAAEARLFHKSTNLIATLPASSPSARVDAAILAAAKSHGQAARSPLQLLTGESSLPRRAKPRSPSRRWVASLSLVASLLLLLVAGLVVRDLIFPASSFQMPAQLTWNGYVVHYIETRVDTQGRNYQVEVYQDLGTNQMHIESTLPGEFDVVVVTDAQTMLGEDMMHHVAQQGDSVQNWAIDGSQFDLAELRQDLATHQATYLGTEKFQDQTVYLIRASNGQVLMLNTHYLPVTVLSNFTSPGTGVPAYQTFNLVLSNQVADSLWDMQVPAGFHMGNLPATS
jgi:hypothetical protein